MNIKTIDINKNDTIIFSFPFQDYGYEKAQEMTNMLQETFPYNHVVTIDTQMSLSVLQDSDYSYKYKQLEDILYDS